METIEQAFTEVKEKSEIEPFRIYKTKNYDLFYSLSGNRRIVQSNFRRLISSIEKKYLFTLVIVNEKMCLIDGQHRFLSCKELAKYLYFIVIPGYGLEEVQILNTNTANWTNLDYLKSYCDQKNYEYIKFRRFMQEYPDFKFSSAYKILTLTTGSIKEKLNQQKKRGKDKKGNKFVLHIKNFANGDLKIPDLKKSETIAQKLLEFKPYYKNFNRTTFVSTMLGFFDNKDYDHKEMIQKLKQQPTALKDCVNVGQYKLLIEDIYNYKRREKISLRY